MKEVQVTGRFVNEKREPINGRIKFTPSNIWVEEDGEFYPCLAPDVELINGRFLCYVTRTDQHGLPWHYTVETPMGKWTIEFKEDGPVALKDLLPKKPV